MSRRSGFTLVELMVVITILVILTTLVLAAFQRDDSDRLNAGARLIQAKIEGAKSMAVTSGAVRGIRFFPDDNDPRTVTSMAYVGANGYVSGTLSDIRINDNGTASLSDDFWELQCATAGHWGRILLRDMIAVGSRIEVPEGSGQWFVLSGHNFNPSTNVVSINEHYEPSEWTGSNYGVQYARNPMTGQLDPPIPYRLELSPTLLPNSDSFALPRGICIDMDASGLPSDWYAPGAYWQLTFGPNGTPNDVLGVLNLYVTTVGDVELTRNLLVDHPANGTATPLAQPCVPGDAPRTPKNEPYLVVVYGQTGLVTTSRANLTDADNDDRADNPFDYALRGRESH